MKVEMSVENFLVLPKKTPFLDVFLFGDVLLILPVVKQSLSNSPAVWGEYGTGTFFLSHLKSREPKGPVPMPRFPQEIRP